MLLFLAFQSLVIAVWVVVTGGLLLGLAGRALSGSATPPGDVAPQGVWQAHMTDPRTALRRRLWLASTAVLAVCLATTGIIVARV